MGQLMEYWPTYTTIQVPARPYRMGIIARGGFASFQRRQPLAHLLQDLFQADYLLQWLKLRSQNAIVRGPARRGSARSARTYGVPLGTGQKQSCCPGPGEPKSGGGKEDSGP